MKAGKAAANYAWEVKSLETTWKVVVLFLQQVLLQWKTMSLSLRWKLTFWIFSFNLGKY
jgi:hypothetical protein